MPDHRGGDRVLDSPHQTKKQRLGRVLVAAAVPFPGHSQFALRDRAGLVKNNMRRLVGDLDALRRFENHASLSSNRRAL